MFLYMLELKTEAPESNAESADDITAAATHPVPIMETMVGVRCCRQMARARDASPRSRGDGEPYVVRFQSEAEKKKRHMIVVTSSLTNLLICSLQEKLLGHSVSTCEM